DDGAFAAGGVAAFGCDGATAVELVVSMTGAARREDLNSIGVTTRTIAINASARRVRLSIQKFVREPGRSPRAEKGGSARCGAPPTSCRATRRGVRALR